MIIIIIIIINTRLGKKNNNNKTNINNNNKQNTSPKCVESVEAKMKLCRIFCLVVSNLSHKNVKRIIFNDTFGRVVLVLLEPHDC